MVHGRLPKGWQLAKLGDLGEVNRGRSRHRPRYAEHLYGGPYPFVQTGDIKSSGGRITKYQQTYNEEGLAQSRLWPAGTMCITIAANIAETAILTFPACFPDSVVGFIADPCKCDIHFIEYTFRHLRQRIQHEATGSVQDNINLGTLDRLRFPVPPLAAQRAIANILGTLDDKIELNRRINETLESMTRAIFKSWFVDFDPVRAKAEGRPTGLPKPIADLFPDSFEDSELGRIPKGWRIVALDTQVEAQKGLSYKGSGLVEAGIPMHNLNSVYEGGGYKFEGIKFYAGEYEERHVVQSGDLIVTNTEQGHDCLLIGYAAVVPKCFGSSGLFTHHLYRVRPLKGTYLTSQYLAFLFNSRAMHEEISGYGNGTTVNMLPADALQRPKIVLPPAPLVHAFDRLAVASFGRCEETVTQNQTLMQIRDALLPRLLSGELSVSQVGKSMKEAL